MFVIYQLGIHSEGGVRHRDHRGDMRGQEVGTMWKQRCACVKKLCWLCHLKEKFGWWAVVAALGDAVYSPSVLLSFGVCG